MEIQFKKKNLINFIQLMNQTTRNIKNALILGVNLEMLNICYMLNLKTEYEQQRPNIFPLHSVDIKILNYYAM